jgi:hypothetical protein
MARRSDEDGILVLFHKGRSERDNGAAEPREDVDKDQDKQKQAEHTESQTKEDPAPEKRKVAKTRASEQPDVTQSSAESNEKPQVERNTQSQNR